MAVDGFLKALLWDTLFRFRRTPAQSVHTGTWTLSRVPAQSEHVRTRTLPQAADKSAQTPWRPPDHTAQAQTPATHTDACNTRQKERQSLCQIERQNICEKRC